MPHCDPEAARKWRQEYWRRLTAHDPDYSKRMYQKHREKRLAEKKAERDADVEKARAYQRASYAKHREKRVADARRYRRKNSEAIAARAMTRYYANRDEVNARRKEQSKRPARRAKHYAYIRKWLKRNPDRADLMHAKRLLNEQTGVPIRDIPKELAEAKVEQLKVARLVRELRAAGAV